MAGKSGSSKNLGHATHGDNKSSQSGSDKDRAGRAASFVSGSKSGGAKTAPCYEGANELQKTFEKAFISNQPAIKPN